MSKVSYCFDQIDILYEDRAAKLIANSLRRLGIENRASWND
jgi:hypothetical protein